MDRLIMSGVVIVFLGLVGFAMPIFTTQRTEQVARIGDLNIQSTETTPHTISPMLSSGAVLLGFLVIGAGLYRRA